MVRQTYGFHIKTWPEHCRGRHQPAFGALLPSPVLHVMKDETGFVNFTAIQLILCCRGESSIITRVNPQYSRWCTDSNGLRTGSNGLRLDCTLMLSLWVLTINCHRPNRFTIARPTINPHLVYVEPTESVSTAISISISWEFSACRSCNALECQGVSHGVTTGQTWGLVASLV